MHTILFVRFGNAADAPSGFRYQKFNNFGTLSVSSREIKLTASTRMIMCRRVLFLSLSVIVVLTSAALVVAQSGQGQAPERKVVTRVEPIYPELAKRMRIHGIVRVEATVRPNGAVKSTRVLGGNPVLVDAAQQAISKWKFEASQNESTQIVQLTFDAE